MALNKLVNLKLKLILVKEPNINYSRIFKKQIQHQRSTVTVSQTKRHLVIEIKARDATALRASANSLIRNLQVIEATKPSK
jgi:tRNA threonylcarbamoyladenosine modification (KEOPS) complex  Pcc1 subunit